MNRRTVIAVVIVAIASIGTLLWVSGDGSCMPVRQWFEAGRPAGEPPAAPH